MSQIFILTFFRISPLQTAKIIQVKQAKKKNPAWLTWFDTDDICSCWQGVLVVLGGRQLEMLGSVSD